MAIGCTWDDFDVRIGLILSNFDWFLIGWVPQRHAKTHVRLHRNSKCHVGEQLSFKSPKKRFFFSVKVGEILWVHISHSRHSDFWSPGLPPIPPLSCTFSGTAGSAGSAASLSLSTSTPLLGFSGIFWSSCLSRGIPSRSKNRFLRPPFSGHGVNPWIYPPMKPFRWNECTETLKPELWVVTGWNLEARMVSCHQIWRLLSFPSHHII